MRYNKHRGHRDLFKSHVSILHWHFAAFWDSQAQAQSCLEGTREHQGRDKCQRQFSAPEYPATAFPFPRGEALRSPPAAAQQSWLVSPAVCGGVSTSRPALPASPSASTAARQLPAAAVTPGRMKYHQQAVDRLRWKGRQRDGRCLRGRFEGCAAIYSVWIQPFLRIAAYLCPSPEKFLQWKLLPSFELNTVNVDSWKIGCDMHF